MSTRRSLGQGLKEAMALLALFLWPSKNRVSSVYDFLGRHNNLAEDSLFLNMGYWKEANAYDEACRALAALVGEAAELDEDDLVLDVGCGFGDQDEYWRTKHNPKQITAINVTRSQLEHAKERFTEPGLKFEFASATELPYEPESFNKITALESAFHFSPRTDFFSEAFKVLKPGGRIAIADVISTKNTFSFKEKIGLYIGRSFWQIPVVNMYNAATYVDHMRKAGFQNIEVVSIAEYVFAPFKAFARKRCEDPEVIARANPFLRKMWSAPHDGYQNLDYVIVTAEKA